MNTLFLGGKLLVLYICYSGFIKLTAKNSKIYNDLDFFATPQISGICSLDLKSPLTTNCFAIDKMHYIFSKKS